MEEETNPYSPGSGIRPPYFAGRDSEMLSIRDTLNKISDCAGEMDHPPNPITVIVGPRGVGKTALLKLSVRMARGSGIHVATVNNATLTGGEDALVSSMFPQGMIGDILKNIEELNVAWITVDLGKAEKELMSALPVFLSEGPLLIVMDEAHTCEPEALELLFDNAQECMSMDLPLAVIIAGTPGLEPLLQRCGATYVERSRFLRFNTLSSEEAKDALEIPAKHLGRPMDEAALKLLLDWSDNYPYFIQYVGEASWLSSASRDGMEINVADAEHGISESETMRDSFFAKRFMELGSNNLQKFAMQAIDIIQQADGGEVNVAIFAEQLMRKNNGMDLQVAIYTLNQLQEFGFVWVNVDKVEPGIPSMFDYMLRHQINV